MIARYTPKVMADLWSVEAQYQRWLKVEMSVIEVLAEDGIVPQEAARRILTLAQKERLWDIESIARYEEVFRHDMIAFLQSVGDRLGEDRRWLHLGLTSYDVVDTALSLALVQAVELILSKLQELEEALTAEAITHKETLMPGRTHGVNAEPITFGWVLCGYIAECRRHYERLLSARSEIAYGKLSGAVGTYSFITPEQEERILGRLGLKPEPVATQVIPRDRHSVLVLRLALAAGLAERLALNLRLLAHSEVEELMEPFTEGQRGSSAMPHKRNPVTAEQLCGLARLVRAYALASLENIPLWHERDISHSSVERIILPDVTTLTYYILDKTVWIVKNWKVNVERMREHIDADRGLMHSSALLVALKLAGLEDPDVYRRVQELALETLQGGPSLKERAQADPEISQALGEKLEDLFNPQRLLDRSLLPFQRLGIAISEMKKDV
ncbi:MAG: adenylosuccinate lyase [bacterium]